MKTELDRVRNALVVTDDSERTAYPALLAQPEGFFSFRYSSTEVFSQGGNLHVKMTQTRYQDGRLTSEECEGTVNRQTYDRLVNEANNYFLNQAAGFMQLLLTPLIGGRRDRE